MRVGEKKEGKIQIAVINILESVCIVKSVPILLKSRLFFGLCWPGSLAFLLLLTDDEKCRVERRS